MTKSSPTNMLISPVSTRIVLVDVPKGLEGEEQGVAVPLQLGSLVGGERVLDGQRVQAELLLDRRQLLLARLVQTDPDEVTRLGGQLADPAEIAGRKVVDDALALAVDGAVDDHSAHASPWRASRRAGPAVGHQHVTLGSGHGHGDPAPARTNVRERLRHPRRAHAGSAPRRPRTGPGRQGGRAPGRRAARGAGQQPAGTVSRDRSRRRDPPARTAAGPRRHRLDRVRLRRVAGPASSASSRRWRCGRRSRPTRRP